MKEKLIIVAALALGMSNAILAFVATGDIICKFFGLKPK
jgi:hypothetical protein